MRMPKSRFWSAAAAVLALNAAGIMWIRGEVIATGVAKIRVLRALPETRIDEAGRLSLVFDESVAEAEELAKPLAAPIFRIGPAAEGHWEWARADRLDFVLAKPLPPGRTYRVMPAVDFEQRTGRRLVGQQSFEFATRPLRVERCRLDSFDRENVTFEIAFNQPVHPDDVLRHVRVWSSPHGTPRDAVSLTKGPAEAVTLRVERLGARRLTVEVDADLAGHGADRPLGKRFKTSFALANVFTLLGADVPRSSLGRNVTVNLRLSSRPDSSQKLPGVEFSPPVATVHVSRGYRSLRVTGPFESGVRYTARVTGRLLSREGQLLAEGETVRFTVPDRRPALSFKNGRGILMPDGNLDLEVEAVNVSGIRFSAWRGDASRRSSGARRGRSGRTAGRGSI